MKNINNKFYEDFENEKYTIHDGKIKFKTKMPESLKTIYEVMFNTKLSKTQSVVELDDSTLQIIDSKNLANCRQKLTYLKMK